jgi:hypothetical protein
MVGGAVFRACRIGVGSALGRASGVFAFVIFEGASLAGRAVETGFLARVFFSGGKMPSAALLLASNCFVTKASAL